ALGLSFLQLILSVVFIGPYIDWFLSAHGYPSRSQAPRGEVLGVYIAVGLRCFFSVFWIFSFAKFLELVLERSKRSAYFLTIYGLITLLGFGYLTIAGGPWWLTSVRGLQTA